MAFRDGADGGTGSARRRKERRLRSWLRHEQQPTAAVLATVTHHSFGKVGTASGVLRNQKTATRTGNGEEYETHFTAVIQKTPPPWGKPAPLPEVAGNPSLRISSSSLRCSGGSVRRRREGGRGRRRRKGRRLGDWVSSSYVQSYSCFSLRPLVSGSHLFYSVLA